LNPPFGILEVGALLGTLPPFSPISWHSCGTLEIGKPYALLLTGFCDSSEVGVSFEGNSSVLLSLEPSGNPEVGISLEGKSSVLPSLKSNANFVEFAVERSSRSWLDECMLDSRSDLRLDDGNLARLKLKSIKNDLQNKIKVEDLCSSAHLIS
jgi:hypothetical protein